MNRMKQRHHRPAGSTWLGWISLAAILGFVLGASSCALRDRLYFADPTAEISLVGTMSMVSLAGGTFVTGTARNTGDLTVEEATAVITIGGATYSGPVGKGVTGSVIDNTLDPDDSGSFGILVPAAAGAISTANLSFTFVLPEPTV